ncbi:response regulator transcription factor [Lentibacter algarum]|uniref:response regulator n=1 Tax=Lentibacter algarum TaxID=576131 RepID=UPI0026F30318|nr:response regulator transcription factor [Lentibacter algarum]
MRILLIEDEKDLAAPVIEHLKADQNVVDWFETVSDGDAAAFGVPYDVILLDLQLPDGDGLDLLKTLRTRNLRTPIIILTARDKVSDRIKGLNQGADDYVIKPYDLSELTARINTVCRRSSERAAEIVSLADIEVNMAEHSVARAGAPVKLTAKEWGVFECLLLRRTKIVPKDTLEQALYAFGDEVESNAIEAHISRLRGKLGKERIVTHRGLGYRLEV